MAKDYNFFVSNDGNDEWSGTLPSPDRGKPGGPFASLEKAKQKARELKMEGVNSGNIFVFVRGGLYALREPLVFYPEDSGSELLKIRYMAYENENPVISGGRRVPEWEKGEDGIWFADASELTGPDGFCRQLFIGGRRRKRATLPHDGFYLTEGGLPTSGQPLVFKCSNEDIKEIRAGAGGEVLILEEWFELRHRILEINRKERKLYCGGVSRTKGSTRLRYCLENVREGLSVPGSWFFDDKEKAIYYHPLPGEDMRSIEAVVPLSDCLVRFSGNVEKSETVKHISFTGFTFCHTAWTLPEEGYNSKQAAYDIPAAVQGSGARGCVFERCRFHLLGGYAVEFADGCGDNRAIECEITDVGAGGIKIGSPNVCRDPDDSRISMQNEISRCHISNTGAVYPGAVGVWIGQSCKNIISGNHIHDTFYTGISAGWTWGYNTSNAHGNIIERNHIHDIARGMLSDLGAVYLLGLQPGTVVRNNIIHDITGFNSNAYGIYLDEGTGGVLVENNLVYRASNGGFYQHYGRENIIRNNIFAFSEDGQIRRLREEGHVSFTFEKNIVYCDKEYPLIGAWSNNQYIFDNNLYFRRSGSHENFMRHTVYLMLTTYRRNPEYFDTVQISCAAERDGDVSGIRHLGKIPLIRAPQDFSPDDIIWQKALLLPELVNAQGQKVQNGETEFRMLRDENYLYVNALCLYSGYDNFFGGTEPPGTETVEISLKPDISDCRFVHFTLTYDREKYTSYNPLEAWRPFDWEGEVFEREHGWRGFFKIPIKNVDGMEGGGDGLWQIFAGRKGLPDVSFRQWRENGQDGNSIFADPRFVSPDEGDFRLRNDSPVFKVGFKPFL